jgi:hypothetical protein
MDWMSKNAQVGFIFDKVLGQGIEQELREGIGGQDRE